MRELECECIDLQKKHTANVGTSWYHISIQVLCDSDCLRSSRSLCVLATFLV